MKLENCIGEEIPQLPSYSKLCAHNCTRRSSIFSNTNHLMKIFTLQEHVGGTKVNSHL